VIQELNLTTPYGKPSGAVLVGEYAGVKVAFIPRHGSEHKIPPHHVPFKANLAALKSIGVRHVIATCVVGSLRKEIEPGSFVVPDQFINLTWGRDDTYAQDRTFVHLSMAHPYCGTIARAVVIALQKLDITHHKQGTVVVIQGPRFSTIAESKMYALWGGNIINMTQYPECYFARELGLCYAALASVTDYDVGVVSSLVMKMDSFDKILPIFKRNTEVTLQVLEQALIDHTQFSGCDCADMEIRPYYTANSSL
jgi:5'-methylthioadenosine phosphorylase